MTGVRIAVDAAAVERSANALADGLGPSNTELLRELAIQVSRGARARANGAAGGVIRVRRGKLPNAGAYPIPVRTGTFGRAFGMQVAAERAIVFNDALYAGALHDGYTPYGNPNAMAIRARPYFDDAVEQDIDIDAAYASWLRRMQRAAERGGA